MTESTQQPTIVVGMADLKTGKNPGSITTNLGSCIGVCLYSDKHKAGGMLHFMLSQAGEAKNKEGFKIGKYADTGIPELLRQLRKNHGITPQDCIAKLFGGAKIIQCVSKEIGADNEAAAREILKSLGIRITAHKTGGGKGYRIYLDLATGKVQCQIFGQQSETF